MKTITKLVFGGIAIFNASSAIARGNKPAAIDKEFAMMDTNHDGKISAAEHAAGAKAMFEKMDANKDGFVTLQEMQNFMRGTRTPFPLPQE